MKENCELVRDLMPLCIDGVAAKESQALVESHVAACKDCEMYYTGMKAMFPGKDVAVRAKEMKQFEQMARDIKRKRRRRRLTVGLLIALAVLIGLGVLLYTLASRQQVVYHGLYQVQVYQTENRTIFVMDYRNNRGTMHPHWETVTEADGTRVLYIYNTRSWLEAHDGKVNQNGTLMTMDIEEEWNYNEVREGTPDESILIYSDRTTPETVKVLEALWGEIHFDPETTTDEFHTMSDISDVMFDYYWTLDELDAIYSEYGEGVYGHPEYLKEEDRVIVQELQERLDYLTPLVPEWRNEEIRYGSPAAATEAPSATEAPAEATELPEAE